MNSSQEAVTREADRVCSVSVYERVEDVLREARASDETIAEALHRVRTMIHLEFRTLTIVRSFVIEDPLNFSIWHMCVRYPDMREVDITHDT